MKSLVRVALLVAIAGCSSGSGKPIAGTSQALRTGVSDDGHILVGTDFLVTDEDGVALPCDAGELTVDLSVSFNGPDGNFDAVPRQSYSVTCSGQGKEDLAIVLDNSASLDDDLPALQEAARNAVEGVTSRGGRASLVRVSSDSAVLSPLTNDKDALEAAIGELRSSDGWTALYDGIRMANETLGGNIAAAEEAETYNNSGTFCSASRKAGILVFTDGQENNSSNEKLQNEEHPGDGLDTLYPDLLKLRVAGVTTPIYAVSLSDKVRHQDMSDLAEATGGRYRRVRTAAQVQEVFGVVAEYSDSTHQVCGAIAGGRCGPAYVRVHHKWTDGDTVLEDSRDQLVNVPCGVKEPSRVVTILLSMSNPGIDRAVASKLASNAVKWASPVSNPKVLVVRDDDHHWEFQEDPVYVREVLMDEGYDVDFVEEPEYGLTDDMLDGYDAVWFSNPGYPMDDEASKVVLLNFASAGGGVIMQGDDIGSSWGGSFSMQSLSRVNFVDNGTDYCGVWIDNNYGQTYHVAFEGQGHPVTAGLTGMTFEYGDDIDNTTPYGAGEEVLAWADVAGTTCEAKPVIIAYTP